MTLEPAVLESIRKYRTRVIRRQLAIVVLPILLAAAIATIMFAAGWLKDTRSGKAESPFDQPVKVAVVLAIFIAAPAGLYAGIAAFQRKSFKNFMVSHMMLRFDREVTRRFSNSLEGVSIAAGIETPDLAMMDIEGLASLSYRFAGREIEVGVTMDALSAGLGEHEAQALMAREVATVLLKDYLKTAMWVSPERVAAFMPTFILFVLLVLALLLNSIPLIMVATVLMFVVAIISYVSNMYEWVLLHLFRGLGRRDELLTDSIAVKLTGNPQAMSTTIEKLSARGLLGYPQPTLRLVTSHISNLLHFSGRGIKGGFNYPVFGLSKSDPLQVAERLQNLQQIARGHWQEFEYVTGGDVVATPNGWE